MANNRKNGKRQIIMSEPTRLLVGKYLTKKGYRLMAMKGLSKAEKDAIWRKYGKNRYKLNPNAKPIKGIFHRTNRQAEVYSLKSL